MVSSEPQEIKTFIEYGLKMPSSSEELQRLWIELLEFYLGVIRYQKPIDKIRPGLQKLHYYFHEAFESRLFESELQLRQLWRRGGLSFRSVDGCRRISR